MAKRKSKRNKKKGNKKKTALLITDQAIAAIKEDDWEKAIELLKNKKL